MLLNTGFRSLRYVDAYQQIPTYLQGSYILMFPEGGVNVHSISACACDEGFCDWIPELLINDNCLFSFVTINIRYKESSN